jgi:two-component system chemotaxis response regulator CheY
MSLTILYIEDNQMVAGVVRDLLACEGWQVEVCADGLQGLREIESERYYDLLIIDHDLPFIHGLLLVERARQLPQRQRLPLIMVSADDHKEAARRAGADLFLRKPEEIRGLVDAIRWLASS